MRLLAGAILAVVAVLALLGAAAPWSLSGWLLLIAAATVGAAGLFPRGSVARRALAAVAVALVAVVLVVRLAAASHGRARLVTLPGATSSRWLGRLVDEQDVSLAGARPLAWRFPLVAAERAGLTRAMRDTYVEMRGDVGLFPSPVLDTWLGRQRPPAFDTLIVEPDGAARAAVVFLHGYAGSFALECWMVARAARAVGAVTVCPSTGFGGHWGGHDGEHTLRATLDYVHGRGIRRVYLAGLSNGAVGAAALAPRFAPSLSGVILISGAPAAGSSGGLPALVVHGERDPMASARAAHAFATRAGARFVGFDDGGHFVLLMRRREAQDAVAGWLRERERDR